MPGCSLPIGGSLSLSGYAIPTLRDISQFGPPALAQVEPPLVGGEPISDLFLTPSALGWRPRLPGGSPVPSLPTLRSTQGSFCYEQSRTLPRSRAPKFSRNKNRINWSLVQCSSWQRIAQALVSYCMRSSFSAPLCPVIHCNNGVSPAIDVVLSIGVFRYRGGLGACLG